MPRQKSKRNTRRARKIREERTNEARQRRLQNQYQQFRRPGPFCDHCQSSDHLGINCPTRSVSSIADRIAELYRIDLRELTVSLQTLSNSFRVTEASLQRLRQLTGVIESPLSEEEKQRTNHAMKYL